MVGDGQLLDAFPTVDVAKDGALHGRQHHVTIQPTPHVLHQRRRTRRTRSVRHDHLHTKTVQTEIHRLSSIRFQVNRFRLRRIQFNLQITSLISLAFLT